MENYVNRIGLTSKAETLPVYNKIVELDLNKKTS